MRYYLVTTDHLSDKLLFKDDEDFKAGMNFTPVIALALDVLVLAFILMSNHVHYIIGCRNKKEALNYITMFKNLYGRYFCRRYKVKNYLRRINVDIKELEEYDGGLENGVAYVLMNSVAAKICMRAEDYPWGSGNCYFNLMPVAGTPITEMTKRAQIKLLHSKQNVNLKWIVTDEGYINPRSYVARQTVEALYRTPGQMRHALLNSSKAKARVESSAGIPAFRDQIIQESLKDLCVTLFEKKTVDSLTQEEKAELLKQLRWRFSADIKQLCRVSGIKYEEAACLLDRL